MNTGAGMQRSGDGGTCRTAFPREQAFRLLSLCLLLMLSLPLLPSAGSAEGVADIKGVRHWSTADYTRVVIDLSAPVEFTKGSLSDPERLFFDLKNARVARDLQKSVAADSPIIKSMRLGQFTADTARIVFDLEVSKYDYKVFSLEDPPRLVIDISATPAEAKSPVKEEKRHGKPEPKSEAKPEKKQEKKPEHPTEAGFLQRRVVIDPGHGGHDPGAVGQSGLYEKDVVLDIALRMRSIMQEEFPQYEVILTRETDVFIPLPERAAIANRQRADFFLSVHVNASPNRQARGIETYLLNWTNDSEALRVAARENQISVKKMKQVQSELGVILASLERESKREDSVRLAGSVQRALVAEMKTHYPAITDLGVKQALFYVLVDAEMASALAEVSFISNPAEERLLADETYRERLARSLVNGVIAYFESAAPQEQKVLVSGKGQGKGRPATARPARYIRKAR